MVVERRYPNSISQSDDYMQHTSSWSDLNKALADDNESATVNLSRSGENNSKPATIYLTDFGFTIPSYAVIKHIRVGYKDKTTATLGSPLIKVLNSYGSSYGVTPSSSETEHIISRDNNQLQVDEVNSTQFGVSFEYPTNNSNTTGTLQFNYVWIEIEYDEPSYFLQVESDTTSCSVGETIQLTFNIKNTSTNNYGRYTTSININLPSEIEYVRKIRGSGTISTGENLTWNTYISNTSSSITIECTTTGVGNVLIQAEENSTGIIATKNINILDMMVDLHCEIPEFLTPGEEVTFTITGETTARTSNLVYVPFNLPECFDFISDDGSADYVPSDDEITFVFDNTGYGECRISCEVLDSPGEYTIQLSYSGETKTFPFTVVDTSLGNPYKTVLEVDDDTLDNLETDVTYTFTAYLKVLERHSDAYDVGALNFRMIVSDGEETVTSSVVETANTYIRKEVVFTYTGNPITITFNGEYTGANPEYIDFVFTEPQIIESEYFTGLCERALLPKPLHNIISSVDNAHVVIPAKSSTGKIRLSGIDWSGFTSQSDIAIHEIKCIFNIANNIPVLATASLIVPSQTVGRGEIIPANDGSEEYTIGKDYDIWNMSHASLDEYEDLEIEIQLKNTYNDQVVVDLRNFYLQFRYLKIENTDALGFSIDGDHSKYYGIFLDDRDLGLGFKSTVKEHREDGSDFAISYLQNVKSKDITIEAYLQACNMDEAVLLADKFTKLVTTKRKRDNRPILKKVRFDDFPDRYWEYILEDEIDWDANNDQKIKLKLTIPDGVAKKNNEVIGTETGYIDSITKVNPVILLLADVDGSFTITDTITGQNITVRDNTILTGDLIRINCHSREVYRIANENEIDITSSVDINSSFFSLIEDYNLETNNTATIQSVTYREAI